MSTIWLGQSAHNWGPVALDRFGSKATLETLGGDQGRHAVVLDAMQHMTFS